MGWLGPPILSVATFVALDFSTTINLGAILVAALVLAVSAIFTIRSNVAKTWHEAYEAEKVRAENAEEEAKTQRTLKHNVLNELAAEKLKTDLTGHQALMIENNRQLAEGVSMAIAEKIMALEGNLLQGFEKQNQVLERIASRLEADATQRENGQ